MQYTIHLDERYILILIEDLTATNSLPFFFKEIINWNVFVIREKYSLVRRNS